MVQTSGTLGTVGNCGLGIWGISGILGTLGTPKFGTAGNVGILGTVGRLGIGSDGNSTLETWCIFRRLRVPSTFTVDANVMSRRSGIMSDKTLMEAIFEAREMNLSVCDDSFGVFEVVVYVCCTCGLL